MAFKLSDVSLPVAASNFISDSKTKGRELVSKVKTTFGGNGDFDKLADSAPTLAETAAQHAFARANEITSSQTTRVMSDIDAQIDAMSPEPFEGTELDALNADILADLASRTDNVSAVDQKAAIRQKSENDHIITLSQPGANGPVVQFRVMPEIVESRTVEYDAIAPPQHPSAFQKYKGTSSTQWTVNATFVCRTTDEATENLGYLNQLRAWTMPYFGTRTAEAYPKKLGAPPPVLILHGWRARMVGPIPVVITSLNWNFPQDVDYIPAWEVPNPGGGGSGKMIPFPTVIKIAIQLVESFSTEEINGFNLAEFTKGNFSKAFAPLKRQDRIIPIPQSADPQRVSPAARRVGTERGRATTNFTRVMVPPTVPKPVVSEAQVASYISPEEPLTNRSPGFPDPGE